jgi:hypothetical protein
LRGIGRTEHTDEDVFQEAWLRCRNVSKPAIHDERLVQVSIDFSKSQKKKSYVHGLAAKEQRVEQLRFLQDERERESERSERRRKLQLM